MGRLLEDRAVAAPYDEERPIERAVPLVAIATESSSARATL
jgi:hypothetical protein